MTNPLTWVGRGASLLASGRAAQRASRGVDRTSQRDGREGRGAATREAWPVPVLSTVAAPAGSDVEQLYRSALPPSRASLREAGRRRAELKHAHARAYRSVLRGVEDKLCMHCTECGGVGGASVNGEGVQGGNLSALQSPGIAGVPAPGPRICGWSRRERAAF